MKTCIQGRIDPEHKAPGLKFSICKDVHELSANAKNLVGVIDTGFSGFIQISRDDARELGLSMNRGFTRNEFADGSHRTLPLAGAVVLVDGCAPIPGIVQVSNPPCSILVGRDFLRKAQKALLVSTEGVYLIDESRVAATLSSTLNR